MLNISLTELEIAFNSQETIKKKFKDLLFLRSKLEYLKRRINDDYNKFFKELVDNTLTEYKKQLQEVGKDNNSEISLTVAFNSASGNHDLFYNLDTFIIDIRRCVEFSLRLTLIHLKLKDDIKV